MFDASGNSLGSTGPVAIGDGSFVGTTAEDRFFGAIDLDGISSRTQLKRRLIASRGEIHFLYLAKYPPFLVKTPIQGPPRNDRNPSPPFRLTGVEGSRCGSLSGRSAAG